MGLGSTLVGLGSALSGLGSTLSGPGFALSVLGSTFVGQRLLDCAGLHGFGIFSSKGSFGPQHFSTFLSKPSEHGSGLRSPGSSGLQRFGEFSLGGSRGSQWGWSRNCEAQPRKI